MTVHPIIVYVAGPYRDPRGHYYVEQNIRRAESIAVKLWGYGIPALCPHTNSRGFDGAAPDDVFLEGDLVMLRRCDAVLLTSDWQRSVGTHGEIAEAKRHGIPVFETLEGLFEWTSKR